jgi:hypothetical protein
VDSSDEEELAAVDEEEESAGRDQRPSGGNGESAAAAAAAAVAVAAADSSDEEAAKEVAADPMLGRRIRVWWTGMRCWYAGEVVSMQRERGHKIHEIIYDADGVRCWHRLDGPPKAAGVVKWKAG